jgi:hypothetical protein
MVAVAGLVEVDDAHLGAEQDMAGVEVLVQRYLDTGSRRLQAGRPVGGQPIGGLPQVRVATADCVRPLPGAGGLSAEVEPAAHPDVGVVQGGQPARRLPHPAQRTGGVGDPVQRLARARSVQHEGQLREQGNGPGHRHAAGAEGPVGQGL